MAMAQVSSDLSSRSRQPAGGLTLAIFCALAAFGFAGGATAGEGPGAAAHLVPHVDGAALGLAWVMPFAGILLSIAIVPLASPAVWSRHYGGIAAFWALAFLVPFAVLAGWRTALYEFTHVMMLDYVPFIILIGTLFVVSGGVRLTGRVVGTPAVNVAFIGLGTVLASIMGTTGAAMLLIRPLMRANQYRRHQSHIVVFFIFLAANIGGALSPLGDPPLFLGFLKGVDFFWPTVHLFQPMVLVSLLALAIFYAIDTWRYRQELAAGYGHGRGLPDGVGVPGNDNCQDVDERTELGLEGGVNLLLLGGVVATLLVQGMWQPELALVLWQVPVPVQNLVASAVLVGIALASLRLTASATRAANGFTWHPILEVARLFAAIFITIIPALAILRAGTDGALGWVIGAVSENGQPNNAMYFWATGILSSFLDNAPTYLVFFNTAGGDAEVLMAQYSQTLAAISAGAVFMGANTYIGNAPNFMVKSIAEEQGIRMPSFFGYMAWSGLILLPLFALTTYVFFR